MLTHATADDRPPSNHEDHDLRLNSRDGHLPHVRPLDYHGHDALVAVEHVLQLALHVEADLGDAIGQETRS
jgi:hypothetical protein